MYGQRTAFDIAFTLVKLCKSIFVQRRKKRKGERKKPARERRVSDAQLGREMSARENRRNIIDKQRRGGGGGRGRVMWVFATRSAFSTVAFIQECVFAT